MYAAKVEFFLKFFLKADIPADLRISKMILFGAIFRCLDPILTIAAIMSFKSPFYSPMEQRDEARKYVHEIIVYNGVIRLIRPLCRLGLVKSFLLAIATG